MRYRAYLKSNHWKALRRRALDAAKHKCEWCGKRGRLHVHHVRYRKLFDVTLGDLAVLCEGCHMDFHYPQRVKRRAKRRRKRSRSVNQKPRQERPKFESLRCHEALREIEAPILAMFEELRHQ